MDIQIPQGAKALIKRLEEHGHEAYIVGGCVRDSLMGKCPSDWDICTSAHAEEMLDIFGDKRVIPTGIQHGTLTILVDDGAYERSALMGNTSITVILKAWLLPVSWQRI